MKDRRKLTKQLKSIGASKTEAAELAHLAKELGAIKPRGLSKSAKQRIANIPPGRQPFYIPRKLALSGAMGAFGIVAIAFVLVAQPFSKESTMHGVENDQTTSNQVQTEYAEPPQQDHIEQLESLEEPETLSPESQETEDKDDRYDDKRQRRRTNRTYQQRDNDWWWFNGSY